MSSDTPEWVLSDCRLWGRQKRRIWVGHDWHGNIDGYAQCLMGRMRDERDGASQGTMTQHWPEVFWGGGLNVQRALLGMPERQHAVLHFQYVWDPEWNVTADRKAGFLGIKRTEYFSLARASETWVYSRLDLRSCSDAQVFEAVAKIVNETLRNERPAAINSQARQKCQREPNLAALNRPRVSLTR